MRTIPAKTIVTRMKNNYWFGADYNMNIYRGCCHGCIYCDSRSECYGNNAFDTVFAKEGALQIVERELRGKRKKGVVATGAMSDPYNPFEEKELLTRGALALLEKYRFGAAIATKSKLVARDGDALKAIAKNAPVIVKVTVTTGDDSLCEKIEPHTPVASERFAAVGELAESGLFTGILLMPVLPFIEDTEENIAGIVRQAARHGARFVYPAMGVTLRDVQRAYYYRKLDELFPGLSDRYKRRYGGAYQCTSPLAKKLYGLLARECEKHGIVYRMRDIIEAYQAPYRQEQLSFL
ncbi:MAG TPA: radical SAM protein [Clostridiales bacterium]|nr:radical SAM protein [Clostridiales bacterium]